MPEDYKKPGEMTSQEVVQKADLYDARWTSKIKLRAARREATYQREVWDEKINKHADATQERQSKKKKRQLKKMDMTLKTSNNELAAKNEVETMELQAKSLDENRAQLKGKEAETSLSLKRNIKQVEAMKEAPGQAAEADRITASGILGEMRIAKAHADHILTGLSKKESQSTPLVMLDAAMKRAIADPNQENIAGAKERIERTVAEIEQIKEERNVKLVQQGIEKTSKELKDKEEAIALIKKKAEIKEKRSAELKSKQDEHYQSTLQYVMGKQKLKNTRFYNAELAEKWIAHEGRVDEEHNEKQDYKLHYLQAKETKQKTDHKNLQRERQERCDFLLQRKSEVELRRTAAINAVNSAKDAQQNAPASMDEHSKTVLDLNLNDAKNKVYGLNEEAADADTQVRHCDKNLARRRRTCSCDDSTVSHAHDDEQLVLLQEAAQETLPAPAQPAPEPWVRRRVVTVDSNGDWVPQHQHRRRRYFFHQRQPQPTMVELPGVKTVCPCCHPNMRPQSEACMVKEVEAQVAKNAGISALRNVYVEGKESGEDPHFRFRMPGVFPGAVDVTKQKTARDAETPNDQGGAPAGAH